MTGLTDIETAARRHAEAHNLGVGWEMAQVLVALQLKGDVERVLEIGTHVGRSLRIWREVLDPDLLVGIQDTDELRPETIAELDVYHVRGRSQDRLVYDQVRSLGGLFDFVYIDGDHHYDAVRRDWELYSPLVRRGGLVVLDDAVLHGNDTVEVYRFWEELQRDHVTALFHAPPHENGKGAVFL